jgi:hypothetical protein
MTEVLARCRACGRIFRSVFSGNHHPDSVFSHNSESCPYCGGTADAQDVYGGRVAGWPMIQEAVEVFRTADVVDLAKFRELAKAASTGTIGTEEAAQRSAEINSAFVPLIALAKRWEAYGLLVAILSLYIAWGAKQSADRSSEDVVNLLRQNNETSAQVLTELRKIESSMTPPVQKVPVQRTTPPPGNAVISSLLQGDPGAHIPSTAQGRLQSLWRKGSKPGG